MYCDYNATSPMSATVRAAVTAAMETAWANPSSPHREGQGAAVRVEYARRQVAKLMGVEPKHVFFTSGATEANAWVLAGAPCRVIASAVEHPSVLAWSDEAIGVEADGQIRLEELESQLRNGPAVVSVMAANNETGVIQPIKEVARLCKEFGSTFHCDATQVPGRMDVDIDADWVTLSAHKFGGPRGIGALVSTCPPSPILRGGQQERGHRAGTLNVPGIVGFGAAASEANTISSVERDRLEAFCVERGGMVVGENAPRLPNTLSVLFSVPGDLVVAGLDLRGVHASTGSACSSGSSQTSHVLAAMGFSGTPIRFSLGQDTRAEPIIEVLQDVLDDMGVVCV
jgi:cysteine desulfurase